LAIDAATAALWIMASATSIRAESSAALSCRPLASRHRTLSVGCLRPAVHHRDERSIEFDGVRPSSVRRTLRTAEKAWIRERFRLGRIAQAQRDQYAAGIW
jgi:hypothetical protein